MTTRKGDQGGEKTAPATRKKALFTLEVAQETLAFSYREAACLLVLLEKPATHSEITQRLGISKHSAEFHLRNIAIKLKQANLQDAIVTIQQLAAEKKLSKRKLKQFIRRHA